MPSSLVRIQTENEYSQTQEFYHDCCIWARFCSQDTSMKSHKLIDQGRAQHHKQALFDDHTQTLSFFF